MSARPGGWVPGIGWVARLGDLTKGDTVLVEGEEAIVSGVGDKIDPDPITVVRWANGTPPAAPEVTDPPSDGGRWIVDGGDGCTTEFATEAEAVAYADAAIQDWCDDGWMEEVDNIFVARLTHRSVRHILGNRADMTDDAWNELTHGGSEYDEWWDYAIEPITAARPAPSTPTVDDHDGHTISLGQPAPPDPSVPLPVDPNPLGIEQTHAALMRLGNELLAEGRTDDASAVLVAAGYIDASVRSARAKRSTTTPRLPDDPR